MITQIRIYTLGHGDNGGRWKAATLTFPNGDFQTLRLANVRGWQVRRIGREHSSTLKITIDNNF